MTVVSRRDWVLFALLVCVSIFLRIFHLENIPAICGDEAWTATQAQLAARGLPHTWIVTSHRLLSPFYIALSYLTQGVDPFGIRYPAFMIGVLTIIISFPILSRAIGKEAAFLATLIVAVLPIHIEFSRLAWELCFVPLFGVMFTAFTLRKKWFAALLAVIAGTLSHPSFINLLPVLVLVFLWARYKENKLPSKAVLILSGLVLIGLGIWAYSWLPPRFIRTDISFESIGVYITGVAGVFMGLVGFAFMADFVPPLAAWFLIILFYLVVIGGTVMTWKRIPEIQKVFMAGIFLSIITIYILAGLAVVSPGFERASLFYCVPICAYLGTVFSEIKFGKWKVFFLSLIMLGSTFAFLFMPVFEHGGKLTREFHTGPVDPKYAAYEWINTQIIQGKKPLFIAEDFSIFWNTWNFMLAHHGLETDLRHISEQGGLNPGLFLKDGSEILSLMGKGAFAIGYADGALNLFFNDLQEQGFRISRKGFKDYAKNDFIVVWSLENTRE